MSFPFDIAGPVGAFFAGLVTSLHCVGMCGPLACAACPKARIRRRVTLLGTYHGGRLVSYTCAGIIAGLVGRRFAEALQGGATQWAIWILTAFFLAIVIGLDKYIRLPLKNMSVPGAGNPVFAWCRQGRMGLLGLSTPLLPCAPLYLILIPAALSGSAWMGGTILLAFGLGTIPLYFLAQFQFERLGAKWRPQTVELMRRAIALVAVALLVTRGMFQPGCPLCH